MTTPNIAVTPQPQQDLVVETLRSGNPVRLKALGSSMLPALWPDDVLTIEPVAASALRPGQIVLCLRDGQVIIHRLIKGGEASWTTRGDAMPDSDQPFEAHHVLGRVVEIARGQKVLLPRPQSFFGRMIGSMVCHFDFFRRLALRLHSLRQEFWLETQELHEPDQLARIRTIW